MIDVALMDLAAARDAAQRALDRALMLGDGRVALCDLDVLARELRDVRHLIDRAMNELRA